MNTNETKKTSELRTERGQSHPASWPEEEVPLRFIKEDLSSVTSDPAVISAFNNPKGGWSWIKLARLSDLRPTKNGATSVVVNYSDTQIAIFRMENGKLYATQQMCPHRRAFVLADGLIGDTEDGRSYVSCPLHK